MHEEKTSERAVKEKAESFGRQLWDGRYEKNFYWVYPADGAPRVKCWPNAGVMNAADGSGREWRPADGVAVALIGFDEQDLEEPEDSKPLFSMRDQLERRRQKALLNVSLAVRERSEVAEVESKTRAIVEGKSWARPTGGRLIFKRGVCKHKFGLAGGFDECSACGVKRDKACTHSFGFAGGFDSCTMCGKA